jgi:hypothetical protein
MGPTGWTGPTGTVGPSAIETYSLSAPQTIAYNTNTLVAWQAAVASNTFGVVGMANGLLGSVGTFTNTTPSYLVIEAKYNVVWNQSVSGTTFVYVNGTMYGLTQFNATVFNNSATFLLPPNASFGVYMITGSNVTMQPSSTLIVTSLSVGPQGPTGSTGCGPSGSTGNTGPGIAVSNMETSITITSTGTDPTFVTTMQQVSYRVIGDKCKITYQMGWTSGTAGSGDYLITLPGNLIFRDAAGYNPVYTGALWSPDYASMAPYLIAALGGIVQSSSWSTSCYVIPYSIDEFRLVLTNSTSNSLTTWNNNSYGVINGLLNLDFEIWL